MTKILTSLIMTMLIISAFAPMVLAQDTDVASVDATSVDAVAISADVDDNESDTDDTIEADVSDSDDADTTSSDADTIGISDSDETGEIKPISNFRHGWNKFRLAFIFNKEKKIERAIEIAEERLAEAEAMAEAGDDEAAEKARARYEEFIERAEGALGKIEAKKEAGAEKALSQTIRAQERIEAHRAKVKAVHDRILIRLREKGNLTDEKLAKLEGVFSRIDTRAERAQDRVLQRQENIRTRYKVLSEKSDEEIDALEAEQRADAKKRIEARQDARRDAVKTRIKARVDAKQVTDVDAVGTEGDSDDSTEDDSDETA